MYKIGNSKLIEKDVDFFKRNYVVENTLMKSANGILFRGIWAPNETNVILKTVPKENCHRFGVMKDRNGLDRVVPIEFALHGKARRVSDKVCKAFDWFEFSGSFCIVLEMIDGYDLFHIVTEFGILDESLTKERGRKLVKQSYESLVMTHYSLSPAGQYLPVRII